MIIIKILGGLGNQLFQYAAARALAAQHHTEVKLDITAFEQDRLRNFDLEKFHFPFSYASPSEIESLKASTTFHRIKARLTPYAKKKFYKQPSLGFDPRFFELGNEAYLQGYFQSEKYFKAIAPVIRNEAILKSGLSPAASRILEDVACVTSVAVHIRRGDYKDATALAVHGMLPADYYHRAVALLKEKIVSPRFYIFTDDPKPEPKELNLPDATLVSGIYTKNHFEDLYLMSHCRHNIIANSSFSWWGAWLNAHPQKIVVAPKNWFNQGPKDTQDLLPLDWITL